ncbi:hypothetical protein JG687_00017033 [Phytophthora cactorum]|uniref:Uncharacterized protein n=1 Tax=Phytophthora cactorum TaxID=29920 RepID=A0A329RIE7_9STRA|nr:hypothetical protein Pcac1_g21453 [Phytophthora cactorum]KAG2796805.1 hypothetical protein PC111_g21560 [Phytophthora cactorum]KAG2829622.1 hypothetical protein PC113_g21251 [Phytophthora cactorum]KAG2880525.1 hypothetical protein PC114_g22037 [Phytophthora cactorum]KAG2885208.1 hypothetical protein PC115_g21072 [Phytophthora cactorum]
MWANHLTRNLNRSTWDAAVLQPLREYIANLPRPVDSQVEAHIAEVILSANTALEVVLGSIADYKELHRTWEAFGRQLQENERRLEVRKSVIEGFLRGIVPPSRRDVIDPLLRIENVEDTEHTE